jgi:rhodanese-related sulfurtransferase
MIGPIPITEILGHYGAYLIYAVIGFAFGYTLEMAGFGNSRKLAAQFYFRDFTVLKVMFVGIVVAMTLVFLASSLKLLDTNLIYVNPTYLWPGILGGLIMGFGFIIGGFCPGTSLVAVATLKLDGVFFTLGVLVGVFLFGETVELFSTFWSSSYMGRLTLPDWLGLSTGTVLLLVIGMALMMFIAAEIVESHVRGKLSSRVRNRQILAAVILALIGLQVFILGQPTVEDRWEKVAEKYAPILESGGVDIHPGELLHLMHDDALKVECIDLRDEGDFNVFNIIGSRRFTHEEITGQVHRLLTEPDNTVFVLLSNDGSSATEAWKSLVGLGLGNVYILEGGINAWLDHYLLGSLEELGESTRPFVEQTHVFPGRDEMAYKFSSALGDRQPGSDPDPHDFHFEYKSKVELKKSKKVAAGGCG